MLLLLLACADPVSKDSAPGDSATGTVTDTTDSVSTVTTDSGTTTGDTTTESQDSDTPTDSEPPTESTPDCPAAWADADGDGFGDPATPRGSCDAEGTWVENDADCGDNDPIVHPGATERCDGADTDCDPATPETATVTWSAEDGSAADMTAFLAAGSAAAPIDLALDNGTWSFCGGTWYVHLLLDSSVVDLVDRADTGATVLDGAGQGSVLTVVGGTTAVSGFEATGGEGTQVISGAGSGGGLACSGAATVTLDGVTFTGNHAAIGGAIAVDDCALSATGVQLEGNTADYGGGLYAVAGSIDLTDSTVSLNAATNSGGGLGLEGAYAPVRLTLTDTAVEENGAVFGGGLVLYEDAQGACTGSAASDGGFRGNTAESDGGGVYLTGADLSPRLDAVSCDFGTGGQDNDPSDVWTNVGAFGYGDDADVVCDNDGCR